MSGGPPGDTTRPFVDVLYGEFLARGVEYFFPGSRLEPIGPVAPGPDLACSRLADETLVVDWLGQRHAVRLAIPGFTDDQARLLEAIGRVLSVRYHVLLDAALAARALHLFRGLPEDRYVSAFLDAAPYKHPDRPGVPPDRLSEAIEVLRVSALTTYESRRIETGVLLFGRQPDPCHAAPITPGDAIHYSTALTGIRSFHRLCDGLQTLALVDIDGRLAELVDVHEWAGPYADMTLPVPTVARYQAHSRATMCGGHVCLVLTPNGEIKVFAEGSQVFNFLDGRWRLTDARAKYRAWQDAIGDPRLGERLFTVALDLAEDRRGGLFLVLDDAGLARELIASGDLVGDGGTVAKQQLHYLLRAKNVLEIAPTVLESIARIDGAIVLDRRASLLSFGAILRQPAGAPGLQATEGGRTTAALGASRFGAVLMVSEDGLVSFFHGGRRVWSL